MVITYVMAELRTIVLGLYWKISSPILPSTDGDQGTTDAPFGAESAKKIVLLPKNRKFWAKSQEKGKTNQP